MRCEYTWNKLNCDGLSLSLNFFYRESMHCERTARRYRCTRGRTGTWRRTTLTSRSGASPTTWSSWRTRRRRSSTCSPTTASRRPHSRTPSSANTCLSTGYKDGCVLFLAHLSTMCAQGELLWPAFVRRPSCVNFLYLNIFSSETWHYHAKMILL